MSQTGSGKAFEFALGQAFSQRLGVPLQELSKSPRKSYSTSHQKLSMDKAALKAVEFLITNEKNLTNATSVILQLDKAGVAGDVRDLIVCLPGQEIGISAKTRHSAIKHSRLSGSIDFGKEWAGYPVSPKYWKDIKPIFQHMKSMKAAGKLFSDVSNKATMFYLPILSHFEDEFKRLYQAHGQTFVERVFRYLIGRHDFYKVVRNNKSVNVQSFNLDGTLQWGQKWTIPQNITQIGRLTGSTSTLAISFDGGWQISFRLHSASSKIEPSLKFDINFSGVPPYASGNHIPLA